MNTDLSTFTFLGLGLAGWLVIFIINCFVVAFWGWIWHHSITTRMDQTNEVLNKIAKALTKIAFPNKALYTISYVASKFPFFILYFGVSNFDLKL